MEGGELTSRSLLILFSFHHHNTEMVAQSFAKVLDAPIRRPTQIHAKEVQEYDLVGFGSGIYGGQHHVSLLNLADGLPESIGNQAFIFSTCGVPLPPLRGEGLRKRFESSGIDNHLPLRGRLRSKGYTILDEFSCAGLNTNSFLRFFGGLNKGRPNADDLSKAVEFAAALKYKMEESSEYPRSGDRSTR
jgi:flavodoxin